jgi:electron transport complex protein RnfB
MNTLLTDRIDALLPQTQCRQCGYNGCRPYADAIAQGSADINRCPPGGEDVINDLAHLLQRPALPLDTSRGVTKPPAVAVIDEAWCIGCTLCIQACPVDAIAGAAKLMHTVIADECTGCELCVPPCPVDCIRMAETAHENNNNSDEHRLREARLARAAHARLRYHARNARLAHHKRPQQKHTKESRAAEEKKRAVVARALQRARQRITK